MKHICHHEGKPVQLWCIKCSAKLLDSADVLEHFRSMHHISSNETIAKYVDMTYLQVRESIIGKYPMHPKIDNLPVETELIQEWVPDVNHACTGTLVTKYKCGCYVRLGGGPYGLTVVLGYNPCFVHCAECQRIEKENNEREPEETWDYELTKQMHNVWHEIKGYEH